MAKVTGVEEFLLKGGDCPRIIVIDGPNFSGRTSVLRATVGLGEQQGQIGANTPMANGPTIYVGPEIYNSISGLASTVADELSVHSVRGTMPPLVEDLIAVTQLDTLFERSAFVLSGGEQACLVFASALLLSPAMLALDSVLEQLASELRTKVLTTLRKSQELSGSIIISDNRLGELGSLIESIPISECGRRFANATDLPIEPLCPEAIFRMPVMESQQLVIDNVSFKYPRGPNVLHNTSVCLDPGRPYVLTGKNGSGKSTFAKLLVGVLKPTRGKLFLGDSVFIPWNSPGRIVGYHFQNPDLQLFETSVFDEVRGGKKTKNDWPDHSNEQAYLALEAFGLTRIANVHPLGLTFPFVLRKRVALAATISMRTDWLILDEPTLGQDETSTRAIAKIVNGLCKLGKGMIVISHSTLLLDLLDAERLILANGEISRG